MSTLPTRSNNATTTVGSPSAGKITLRDIDVTVAETELRLGLQEALATLEAIEQARVVSQETLEFKFSI